MKKTLIALMALAGMAVGDVTIGSYITKDGVNYDIVDSFAGQTYDQVKDNYGVHLDKLHFKTLEFTLNTGEMLVSDSSLKEGAELALTSLTILGRRDTDEYKAIDSTMTLTLGDSASYTSETAVWVRKNGGCATITYSFADAITFKLGDELTFTFNKATGEGITDALNNLGVAPMQNASGTPVVWSGGWQIGAQLTAGVVQDVPSTPSIPEPATATLSLLALAGLAARRRRH